MNAPEPTTPPGEAFCEVCGNFHPVEYHHEGRYGQGPIFVMSSASCRMADHWRRADGTLYDTEFVTLGAWWRPVGSA